MRTMPRTANYYVRASGEYDANRFYKAVNLAESRAYQSGDDAAWLAAMAFVQGQLAAILDSGDTAMVADALDRIQHYADQVRRLHGIGTD